MKRVVVSGINIDSGGALSVFRDCLIAARARRDRFRFTALVHDRRLFDGVGDHVEYLEFPQSKRRWWRRLAYEYRGFRALSRELDPYLWFSLHDMTPTVHATRRAVYCHNPAPFHRLRLSDFWFDPSIVVFRLLYSRLYATNIGANDAVVVQQQWMREEFRRCYGVEHVVVAHPELLAAPEAEVEQTAEEESLDFIYPCFPRVFKNVELACRAFASLGESGARLLVTLDGEENRYARSLRRRYGDLPTVRFIGRRTRDEVFALYRSCRGMVFPSTLETWGMPLSEFRATGKPIFAADLPYARETLAGYGAATFFDPRDPASLAAPIAAFLATGELDAAPNPDVTPAPPFARGWEELWDLLLDVPPPARASETSSEGSLVR